MQGSGIRRKDRILRDNGAIRTLLEKTAAGTFAFVDRSQPYLNPSLFIYKQIENAIYFHATGQSRIKHVIESNNNACFLIYSMGRLLPGPNAIDLSVEYTSVIVHGKVSVVTEEVVVRRIFQEYMNKYFPRLQPRTFKPFTAADAAKAILFKLSIDHITAKKNQKPPHFGGAITYNPL